jgi:hypothetical protein
MSTALRKVTHATFHTFTVAAGQATTAGELVVLATDTTVQDAGGASDLGIGVAATTQAAGERVDVYLFGPVIPVEVGTGDATRGTKAIHAADGFTDAAAHDSSGATDEAIYGVFMQSGTVGQIVGLMFGLNGNRGAA